MKENGRIRSRVGREQISLQIKIFIQACTNMDSPMGMDSTNGNQELHILENSLMVISKEKGSGRRMMRRSSVINTVVNTSTTKKMVKDSSTGIVEITILELTPMTLEMDMVKCIGLMERYTKDSGSMVLNTERVNLFSLTDQLKKAFLKIMSFKRNRLTSPKLLKKKKLKIVLKKTRRNQ